MIVVRTALRPCGWKLLVETLLDVDRQGGQGVPRIVVADQEPPPSLPPGWRLHLHQGIPGSRMSLWVALTMASDYPGRVLILEDDIHLARHATDRMLGADMGDTPMVSFFFPRYDSQKARTPGYEVRPLTFFRWSQALLLDPMAIIRILDAGIWPALPRGGDHGGDYALREALRAVGYEKFRLHWPNLVEHTGLGPWSTIEKHRRDHMTSGWFAGDD